MGIGGLAGLAVAPVAAAAAAAAGSGWPWALFPVLGAGAAAPSAAPAYARCFHSSAPARAPAQDHYKTLGIASRSASKADIKKQYYKLAKQYHPDTSGDSSKQASDMFTKVQAAYEVLGDDKARKEYDARTSYSSNFSSSYSSASANSGGSSYSQSSASSAGGGFGVHPEMRDYSYYAWSTRSGVNSRTGRPGDFGSAWEYVEEDDEGDITEEELFADLFGQAGFSRHGATFGFKRPPSSSASSRARVRRPSASASAAGGARTARQKREDAERDAADEARARSADATFGGGSGGSASTRSTRSTHTRKKRTRATAGQDLSMSIPLTFVEAACGTTKSISFQADGTCRTCTGSGVKSGGAGDCRQCGGRGVQNMRMPGYNNMHVECDRCEGSGTVETQCGTCHGSGHVKEKRTVEVSIPAGVDVHTNIRLLHQGHAGKHGGSNGHLLLKTTIAPHATFTRQGFDLHVEHSLPLTTALLGGVAQVPSLDGGVHSVRVESGTQHGAKVTIPGRGIRILPENGKSASSYPSATMRAGVAYGAQQVTFHVHLPRSGELSAKSKDLLKQLALEMGNIHNIDLTTDVRRQSAQLAREKEKQAQQERETREAEAHARRASEAAAAASVQAASATAFSSRSSTGTGAGASATARPASSSSSGGFTVSSAFASFAAAAAGKRAASSASAHSSAANATAIAAAAAAAAAASSTPSATAAAVDHDEWFDMAGGDGGVPPLRDSRQHLQDKRSRRKQTKRALKQKEHRHSLHIEPIRASASRIDIEDEEPAAPRTVRDTTSQHRRAQHAQRS